LASTPLYWIEGVTPGRLAIFARPRGGDWLSDEAASWKRQGVNVLVSLLTPEEEAEFSLANEGELCRQAGIEFHAFPIGDRELPASRDESLALAHRLAESVREGKAVAIHCRAGIGRSTMLAASVLIALGETPERALERIAEARRGPVPDTPEQRQWILDLARARIPA
jgi:predicted protein tyrosine phosphatase